VCCVCVLRLCAAFVCCAFVCCVCVLRLCAVRLCAVCSEILMDEWCSSVYCWESNIRPRTILPTTLPTNFVFTRLPDDIGKSLVYNANSLVRDWTRCNRWKARWHSMYPFTSRVSRILKYPGYQYRNTLNMRSHVQAPGVCYRSSLQGPVDRYQPS